MSIRQVDIEEKREQEREQTDFYGEIGCCKTCSISDKENRRGLQTNLWYNGKHYTCVCLDCNCTKCCWYNAGKCLREAEVIVI